MAEHETRADDESGAQAQRQLVVRAVVVVGLIVVLVAGLVIFERRQDDSDNAPQPALSAVSRIGKTITSAVSSPALPEEVSRAVRDAPDVTQAALASMSSAPAAAPVVAAAPAVVETPEEPTSDPTVPFADEAPAKGAKPGKAHSTTRPASAEAPAKAASSAPAAKSADKSDKAAEKGSDRVVIESGRAAPPARATAAPAELAAPVVSPAQPHPAGYVVQMGVFSNVANAEELRSRLALAGIPAQMEARVQIGPFKNRDEALRAQEKLRSLGLAPGMLVPPRKP